MESGPIYQAPATRPSRPYQGSFALPLMAGLVFLVVAASLLGRGAFTFSAGGADAGTASIIAPIVAATDGGTEATARITSSRSVRTVMVAGDSAATAPATYSAPMTLIAGHGRVITVPTFPSPRAN